MSNTVTLSGGKCQTLRALKRQQLHFYFKLQSRQKLDFQMRKLQFDAAEAQTLCVSVCFTFPVQQKTKIRMSGRATVST